MSTSARLLCNIQANSIYPRRQLNPLTALIVLSFAASTTFDPLRPPQAEPISRVICVEANRVDLSIYTKGDMSSRASDLRRISLQPVAVLLDRFNAAFHLATSDHFAGLERDVSGPARIHLRLRHMAFWNVAGLR